MKTTIQATMTLVVKDCPTCFMPYGVPERFDADRQKDGKTFYCPQGHSIVYTESEIDRLKKEFERKIAQKNQVIAEWNDSYNDLIDQKTTVERRLSSTRGVVTRMRNRIAAGTCPCCRRNFENLARHMKRQHPEFTNQDLEV